MSQGILHRQGRLSCGIGRGHNPPPETLISGEDDDWSLHNSRPLAYGAPISDSVSPTSFVFC